MNQIKITNLEFIESISTKNRNIKGGRMFDVAVDAAVDAAVLSEIRLGFPIQIIGYAGDADAAAVSVVIGGGNANADAKAKVIPLIIG